jgi:hypothetical protein
MRVILNGEMEQAWLNCIDTDEGSGSHRLGQPFTQTPQLNPLGFLENPSSTEIVWFDTLGGLLKGRLPRQPSLPAAS